MDSKSLRSFDGHLWTKGKNCVLVEIIININNFLLLIEKNMVTTQFLVTSNFSLLSKCPSNDLKLLESIYIHKFVLSLNNQNSSCPLNILN